MTLSTKILVHEKTDAQELHDWCNKNLLGAESPEMDVRDGSISNAPGQGFSAWLITHHYDEPINWLEWYGLDGDKPDYYEQDEWDEERARYEGRPSGYVLLDFDTAYGYRDNGLNCGELHASFIFRLAEEFFLPRGLTFAWQNEYSGEWFEGLDGLDTLHRGTTDALDWFDNIVRPVIEAEVAAEGGTIRWEE